MGKEWDTTHLSGLSTLDCELNVGVHETIFLHTSMTMSLKRKQWKLFKFALLMFAFGSTAGATVTATALPM